MTQVVQINIVWWDARRQLRRELLRESEAHAPWAPWTMDSILGYVRYKPGTLVPMPFMRFLAPTPVPPFTLPLVACETAAIGLDHVGWNNHEAVSKVRQRLRYRWKKLAGLGYWSVDTLYDQELGRNEVTWTLRPEKLTLEAIVCLEVARVEKSLDAEPEVSNG